MLDARDDALRRIPRQRGRRGSWAASPLRGEGTEARRAWRSSYVRRVVAFDVVAALVASVVGQIIEVGAGNNSLASPGSPLWTVFLLPVLWAVAMLVARSYEERFLWIGAEEFRRVFFAAVLLLGTLATLSWAFRLEVARGFAVVAVPLATALTLS